MWTIEDRGALEIALDHPVSNGDTTLKTLTMRRPTVKDILRARAAGRDELVAEVELLACLAGVETAALEALAESDYRKLTTAYARFFPDAEAADEAPAKRTTTS